MEEIVDMTSADNSEASPSVRLEFPYLPPGNYCVIGWDMDTTGRRLQDEICQIAAYTPTSQFSQYIMPNGDLVLASRRRHNIRIVTVGRYRLLKSNADNKVLKTKSEISALMDFISWLEETQGDAVDGVILIFHEPRRTLPHMLIEALKRFNLLDRFQNTVKGFCNGFSLAESKCPSTLKSFGLRMVTRVLLDKRGSLENAVDRARLAYQVAQQLTQDEKKEYAGCSGDPGAGAKGNMIDEVRSFTQPISAEEKQLEELKQVIDRQKTFRPVFEPMLSSNRFNRQHAGLLRRILAEGGTDYNLFSEAYGKSAIDGIEQELVKLNIERKEYHNDLLEILSAHFTPKEPANVKQTNSSRPGRRNARGKKPRSKEDNSSSSDNKADSGASTPDTTTSSSLKEAESSSITSSDGSLGSENQDSISSED